MGNNVLKSEKEAYMIDILMTREFRINEIYTLYTRLFSYVTNKIITNPTMFKIL